MSWSVNGATPFVPIWCAPSSGASAADRRAAIYACCLRVLHHADSCNKVLLDTTDAELAAADALQRLYCLAK